MITEPVADSTFPKDPRVLSTVITSVRRDPVDSTSSRDKVAELPQQRPCCSRGEQGKGRLSGHARPQGVRLRGVDDEHLPGERRDGNHAGLVVRNTPRDNKGEGDETLQGPEVPRSWSAR